MDWEMLSVHSDEFEHASTFACQRIAVFNFDVTFHEQTGDSFTHLALAHIQRTVGLYFLMILLLHLSQAHAVFSFGFKTVVMNDFQNQAVISVHFFAGIKKVKHLICHETAHASSLDAPEPVIGFKVNNIKLTKG